MLITKVQQITQTYNTTYIEPHNNTKSFGHEYTL